MVILGGGVFLMREELLYREGAKVGLQRGDWLVMW